MNRHFILVILASLSLSAFLGTPAFAMGNAQREISTAIEHAGFASDVKSTKMVHLHLHHVVNCLVGPHGVGFFAPAGNPCKGMGNGALHDLKGRANVRSRLEIALREAKIGLRDKTFKSAHARALRARRELMMAKEAYR
jgi:hypothetical protein